MEYLLALRRKWKINDWMQRIAGKALITQHLDQHPTGGKIVFPPRVMLPRAVPAVGLISRKERRVSRIYWTSTRTCKFYAPSVTFITRLYRISRLCQGAGNIYK
jgi:hypothetical protein